jgi:23S rRNA pseudouridine1911/1915/1917 synthase
VHEPLRFVIGPQRGRLDTVLASLVPQYSRSHLKHLIEDGCVRVNGNILKPKYSVSPGDEIEVTVPPARPVETEAQDIPLDIVYEDEDIIVVNKPQGMVVHPAPGNPDGTLVNALLHHCEQLSGINGMMRPGIVHRIDKDTSGLIVAAKTDAAYRGLAAQIKAHTARRIYWAVVEGIVKEDTGIIDAPIGRHPVDRKRMAVTERGRTRRAVTEYSVLTRYAGYTLIEARLQTGRTHQIRVHMAHIGHPLVGDPVYGRKRQQFNLPGQALHAVRLIFTHPVTGEQMEFSAPPPASFMNLTEKLKRMTQNRES